MKTRIPFILLGVFGLAAVSVAQDTGTVGLDTWLCTNDAALDAPTRQALKIQVGSATREDVARLLGTPSRTLDDADCEATEYDVVWEYLFKDADGKLFRIHVAFSTDGKVSLVARIPQRGKIVVLAYAGEKEHQH
jgi:hypothetical protein